MNLGGFEILVETKGCLSRLHLIKVTERSTRRARLNPLSSFDHVRRLPPDEVAYDLPDT